jgi:hypothetical protein
MMASVVAQIKTISGIRTVGGVKSAIRHTSRRLSVVKYAVVKLQACKSSMLRIGGRRKPDKLCLRKKNF